MDCLLKALCGASALHFSAEIGNVEIGEALNNHEETLSLNCFPVRCLLDHGAKMEENEHGMTPLKVMSSQVPQTHFQVRREPLSTYIFFSPTSKLKIIQAAAERCQAVMVDYLIERPEVNR